MKRIFFFLSLFFLGTGAWAQIVFDERGLSEDLPYPQWTTPTPACYDIAAEAHRTLIDMRRNWDSNDDPYCDGGSRDNGVCVEAKSTGFTTSYGTTASHYRTSAASGGAEIFYPPFANVNIRYIVQKGGAAGDDYVRFRRETWYAADLKVSGAGITDNTFSDLDHLRYSSYLFDETGAARVTYPNVNSSCPFKNDGGWANQLLCATASAVRFNRAPIISDDMETSAHVKTNIVKAVYYGDADKNTDLTLSTAVGNGSVRTYCFAPLVGHSEFFAYQTKDFNMEGQDTKTQAHGAFYSKQEGSKSGAHNYRFKVTDWDKPALRSQVSIYNDATFPNVKKLNNGLEVFIVVLAGEVKQYTATATTHVGGNVTFYGKPRLLRTHVYPIKPKWNRVKFRNNFCVSDGVVDLKEYVDMGSAGTAHCVFEAVEGGVEGLLDGSHMNLGAYASASVRQSLKIRCYPYGKTSGNEDFSPYMDFTAWVYPSPSVAVENELEKVCSYTDNFQPARFAADPLGAGIYAYNGGNASRYFTGGRLNAVNLAADGITSAPMKYTFTLAESGCSITQTYNQPVTLAPDLSDFVMPKTSFCFDETINLRGQTSVVGGEFSGFGVSGSEETFSTSLAGIGNGDIYFRKTESGCNAEKRITVNVRDLQESSVVFNQPPAMCANDAHVYLPDYLSDAWASGGTFSGSGVESPRFYPDRANGGYPRISYAYGLTGCRVTLTKEVRVKTPQTLTIANIPAVCNTNEIDLMNYVNIKDGVFTAAGGYINGSAFDPVQSGIGSHPVTYSVTDANGCILSRTFNVIVNDLLPDDAVFDAIPEQCGSDAGYIDLRFYVRGHTGGTFSGRGVENFRFYPSQAAAGFNMVTYSFGSGGCRRTLQTEILVTAVPAVTFQTLPRVCDNDPLRLIDYVTPKGGVFTGAGVTDNLFYPTTAGLGTHSITYVDSIGSCRVTGSAFINVVGLSDNNAALNPIPEQCFTDEGYIDLRGYLANAPDNGTFTGQGVDGFRFYPKNARVGFNTITYSFMSGTCPKTLRQEVLVRNPPAVTFRSIGSTCTNTAIDLMPYVNNRGGDFAGNGVEGGVFYPDLAGLGAHEITYTKIINGCPSRARITINAADLENADIAFAPVPPVCKSDSGWLDLRSYVNHGGGTFSGQGVENYRFYPSRANDGYASVSYAYGAGTCRKTITAEILVRPRPVITTTNIAPICVGGVELNLAGYVSPKGGVFSGNGVSGDGVFSAMQAGIGMHVLHYQYADGNGCLNTANLSVNVLDNYSNAIAFGGLPQFASTDEDFYELSTYVTGHSGGSFAGQGIENGRFFPNRAGTGFKTLTYAYGTGACARTIRTDAYIQAIPATIPIALPKVCGNEPLALMNYVNNKGGTFAGNGVQNNVFYPEYAGFGTHPLTYAVQMGIGVSRAALTAEVLSVAVPPAWNEIASLCKTDSDFIDLREYIINYQEGTFGGQGVESYRFYPMRARDGFNAITYAYGSGSCQRTLRTEIYVLPKPNLIISPVPRVCSADSIYLGGLANLSGGVWSGAGVFADLFLPVQAGIGTHTLTYSVQQGQCAVSGSVSVEVAHLGNVRFRQPLPDFCSSQSDPVYLFDLVENSADGLFSGTGVEQNRYFYPNKITNETADISYAYGSGACQRRITAQLKVYNAPNQGVIEMEGNLALCGGKLDLDALVEPKGGTWSGAHIYEGVFYGDSAPIGETEAVYAVANKGCRLTKSVLIKNEPAQSFDFSVDMTQAAEGGRLRFVPANLNMREYTWHFGDGGYSKETSPHHYYYHTGAFDVRLEVKNALGCLLNVRKDTLVSVGADAGGTYVQAAGARSYITPEYKAAAGCEDFEVVIFPNPAENGVLRIGQAECVESVEIYDLSMRLAAVRVPQGDVVDIAQLPQGIYLALLKLEGGGVKAGKFAVK